MIDMRSPQDQPLGYLLHRVAAALRTGVREAERHVLAKLSEQDRRDFRRLLATLAECVR